MPKSKVAKPKRKSYSPFKDEAVLEKEITDFINKFKTTVKEHSKRISDYFEMSCYNLIVQYYELNGYTVAIENLQSGQYRYKCSTAGVQSNFSNFHVSITKGRKTHDFEVHHNLAVQSCHNKDLFTTPDITVIKRSKVKETTDYYETKKRFCYIKNVDLITFCEVKQFNPFPELLFNFIGIINELRCEILTNSAKEIKPLHIAPSLMISGKPNKQAEKIKEDLEKRYCINVFYDLFHSGTATFSLAKLSDIRCTGKLEKTVALKVSDVFD
jgi:hypothetical protein